MIGKIHSYVCKRVEVAQPDSNSQTAAISTLMIRMEGRVEKTLAKSADERTGTQDWQLGLGMKVKGRFRAS